MAPGNVDCPRPDTHEAETQILELWRLFAAENYGQRSTEYTYHCPYPRVCLIVVWPVDYLQVSVPSDQHHSALRDRNGWLKVWKTRLTRYQHSRLSRYHLGKITSLISRFMGPTWGPSGADRAQVGPILVPWTLQSGIQISNCYQTKNKSDSKYCFIIDNTPCVISNRCTSIIWCNKQIPFEVDWTILQGKSLVTFRPRKKSHSVKAFQTVYPTFLISIYWENGKIVDK